ncbi:armadillo-type protein [Paraphysoderma sedebokerense]|nr:armadillo-type protein [Paraphysoderma sedebokerense]
MGVISPLIQCLDSSDTNLLRSASFALLNVMRGPNPRIPHFLDSGIIAPLLRQIQADHDEITQSELWSLLAYITCHHANSRLMLIKHDVVLLAVTQLEKILSRYTLDSLSPAVCIPHVRFIGTYASSNNDKDCVATADSRVICSLMGCLNPMSKALKREALWVLANITVMPEAVSLFDLQMLNTLLDLFLDSEQSFDNRRLVNF